MRIFLASADERLRLGLLMLLNQEPGMIVVGMSDRYQGLLAQLEGSQPDVLLLDWELSVQPAKELLTKVRNVESQPKIIVLTARTLKMETIIEAGANYLIYKDAPPDELLPILNKMQLSETK